MTIDKKALAIVTALGMSMSVGATNDVKFKAGYQYTNGSYSSTAAKKSIVSNGFILNATFLDDITVTHTNTKTNIEFVDPANNIDQVSMFTTLGYNFYTDANGVVNVRADYQSIDNNDPTGATDNVSVNSYQASVTPYDEKYYVELGMSTSEYPFTGNTTYSDGLTVDQFNATYGTGLTASDWLTLKLFQISSSDKTRTHGQKSYSSVEAKYKYFLGDNFTLVNNVEFSTLLGKRIFAVDGAAGSAYNVGDLQTGSVGVTTEWKVGEDSNLLFSLSRENYRTAAGVDYSGDYRYINFNIGF
jgi:hypothetical protein